MIVNILKAGSIAIAVYLAGVGLIMALWTSYAYPLDSGQWANTDPDLRAWYESLKRPDVPTMSCCGVADAYFCDGYRMEGGKAVCTITDDRPDEPRRRPHVPVGTVIEIPPAKLMREGGNPTGHGVVFMTRDRYVWCYVTGGGV